MNNPKWPQIPDRPDRILISGGSGSGKTNDLLSVIKWSLIIHTNMQKIHMKQISIFYK